MSQPYSTFGLSLVFDDEKMLINRHSNQIRPQYSAAWGEIQDCVIVAALTHTKPP